MRASQIASITAASLLTAGVGYAIYFDYKRQNDPEFRKQLKRESKKTSKAQKKDLEANKRKVQEAIDEVLRELSQPGAVPSDLAGRERFFNETILVGESLLALGPSQHLPAAASFFKAIKVYPSPVELIMIYQKAFPEPLVSLIMEMIQRDAELGGADPSAAGFNNQNPLAALAGLAQSAPSSLEEIDDDHTPTHLAAAAAASASAAGGETSSSGVGIPEVVSAASGPSSQASSQEWDKLSGASLGPSPPADADVDVDVDVDAEDVTKSSVDTNTTTTTTNPAYTSTDAAPPSPGTTTQANDKTETSSSSSSSKADQTSPFNFAAGSYAPSPVFKEEDKVQDKQSEVVGEEKKD